MVRNSKKKLLTSRCLTFFFYDTHQHNLLNVNNLSKIMFLEIHRSGQPLKIFLNLFIIIIFFNFNSLFFFVEVVSIYLAIQLLFLVSFLSIPIIKHQM